MSMGELAVEVVSVQLKSADTFSMTIATFEDWQAGELNP
jgi:hypothetical protein